MKTLPLYSILAGLLLLTAGCQSNRFVGTWEAVDGPEELKEDVFSASLILDEDGFALGQAAEARHRENEAGERVAYADESHAITGTWEQATDRRVDIQFVIKDGDEEMILKCVGWLSGSDTMNVTLFSPEDQEAYEIKLERVAGPASN